MEVKPAAILDSKSSSSAKLFSVVQMLQQLLAELKMHVKAAQDDMKLASRNAPGHGRCLVVTGDIKPGQTIATCQHNISQHCWAQHVACVWPPCFDMLGVVGSSLKMVKFEPTTPNMSQQSGQTHATCCAQQCCDMLCWHVAIV